MNAASLAEALIESSPDGLLLVDDAGIIGLANPSATKIFGRSADELMGRPVEVLVPLEQREAHVRHRTAYTSAPERRPMGTGLQLLAEHADGSLFPVEISLNPVTLDGELHTIATVRDVSDRQDTLARVALMQDRERIARDIHDTVIQQLFAAGMTLEAAIAETSGPATVTQRLRGVAEQLDETIHELRDAISQLVQIAERGPLSRRIGDVVDDLATQLGFVPTLELAGDVDELSDDVAEHLLTALSEALTNVARRGDAAAATVAVSVADGVLELTVSDDGEGRDDGAGVGGSSNMARQADELGGSCATRRAAPTGTTVVWRVPLGS
jgi:two-component system sensor histidine kinase DevS